MLLPNLHDHDNDVIIMIDYSSFKVAFLIGVPVIPILVQLITLMSYPRGYTTHGHKINFLEDYEKATHQSCHSLDCTSQLFAPEIKWIIGKCNYFQANDDYNDHLNLRYDVNKGTPLT